MRKLVHHVAMPLGVFVFVSLSAHRSKARNLLGATAHTIPSVEFPRTYDGSPRSTSNRVEMISSHLIKSRQRQRILQSMSRPA